MLENKKTGWDLILEEEIRTPDGYKRALCSDLQVLSEDPDSPDSDRADSLLKVVDLLAGDLAWKQNQGNLDDSQSYQDLLNKILGQFPDLMHLQDLDVWGYAGCWLDAIERGLEVVRMLPIESRWKALLTSERGHENRQIVLRFLYSVRNKESWNTVDMIIEKVRSHDGEKLGKSVTEEVLSRFHDHGLVVRDSYGSAHRFRISLMGINAVEKIFQEESE